MRPSEYSQFIERLNGSTGEPTIDVIDDFCATSMRELDVQPDISLLFPERPVATDWLTMRRLRGLFMADTQMTLLGDLLGRMIKDQWSPGAAVKPKSVSDKVWRNARFTDYNDSHLKMTQAEVDAELKVGNIPAGQKRDYLKQRAIFGSEAHKIQNWVLDEWFNRIDPIFDDLMTAHFFGSGATYESQMEHLEVMRLAFGAYRARSRSWKKVYDTGPGDVFYALLHEIVDNASTTLIDWSWAAIKADDRPSDDSTVDFRKSVMQAIPFARLPAMLMGDAAHRLLYPGTGTFTRMTTARNGNGVASVDWDESAKRLAAGGACPAGWQFTPKLRRHQTHMRKLKRAVVAQGGEGVFEEDTNSPTISIGDAIQSAVHLTMRSLPLRAVQARPGYEGFGITESGRITDLETFRFFNVVTGDVSPEAFDTSGLKSPLGRQPLGSQPSPQGLELPTFYRNLGQD